MRFRSKHIADSVVERIQAVANNRDVKTPDRGAATIHLDRGESGDMIVTKTFEHGEPEILTISNASRVDNSQAPPGFTEITPGAEQPGTEQPGVVPDAGGIVENAAQGGNAIDALLQSGQG